jgi:hypothetical protein
MNTSKVKRILSGEAKLTEGSTVEVDFDGLDYEVISGVTHSSQG